MKEIWTLIIKTSLPNTAEDVTELDTTVVAFSDFEVAKSTLREKLKNFAFNKNSMFDGQGGIIELDNYCGELDDESDDESDDDDRYITARKMNVIRTAFKNIFEGKDIPLPLKDVEFCVDWMIAFDIKDGEIKFYGYDDGPCNGYDPRIKTNMFDMTEEKDYYLYINDRFGQDDNTSELYIDLIKTTFD